MNDKLANAEDLLWDASNLSTDAAIAAKRGDQARAYQIAAEAYDKLRAAIESLTPNDRAPGSPCDRCGAKQLEERERIAAMCDALHDEWLELYNAAQASADPSSSEHQWGGRAAAAKIIAAKIRAS